MKNSDLFVACLVNEWVEYVFGVPGEENLDLLESLRTSGIRLIVTRNEQTAVFMAATYGRMTGKPWVALATLGPWATNMVTGIAYAHLGAMPVVTITGQKPIKASKQWQFQVIDVVGMMQPITKRSTSVVNGARIPSTVREAFKLAEMERPWPVSIEFPEDIAAEEITGYAPMPYEKIRRPEIDEKMLQILVDRLQSAKRPMLLVGAGANRKRIGKYLTQLITKHHIPFFTSQMGKGVVDESLPQFLGTAALTSKDYVHDAIQQADLIIAIGHDTIEKPTNIIDPSKTNFIHINFYPSKVDTLYMPSLEVIGDIGNTLWQLCEATIDTKNWDLTPIRETKKTIDARLAHQVAKSKELDHITPAFVIDIVQDLYQHDGIVCLDNGLYKVYFARLYQALHPQSLLLDNALATMGAWYSSAMMCKLLYPEKAIIAVVGDGGILMNLGDIQTAVSLGIDLVIVILNDNAYGMIKRKQQHGWFADYGLDLTNPDFVKLAKAFGAHGHHVSQPSDLASTITTAKASKGVHIIDVDFRYPEDVVE